MNPSQEVYESAQRFAAADGCALAEALNAFIGQFVGWPFSVAAGQVVHGEGNRTAAFTSVVHTTPMAREGPCAGGFPADGVAAVLDAMEIIDIDALIAAYTRVASVKRIKKMPAPDVKGAPTTTVTLGIILARHSAVPLEELGLELERLNAATPGRERPSWRG
jgi:hypothetical protein